MNEEKNSIIKLKTEFKKIKDMGYVKAINNNYSGIGLTLEYLLGKKIDDFPLPDYYGIELKTKLSCSTKPFTLFRLTPNGKSLFELNRLVTSYGYYTKSSMEYKYFNGQVFCNKLTKIGNYYFKLNINEDSNKIELFVYNADKILIDTNSYWSLDDIKISLYRKLNYLAVIYTHGKIENCQHFYYYYKLATYKLKSFDIFLHALYGGIVFVSFSVDIHKSGNKLGMPHNHGVCFSIYGKYLDKIFNKIE